MAGNGSNYEFVLKVPQDFICSICLSVLQQPQMVNCCEKRFCESCLSKWMATDVSCPQCRSTDFCHMSLKKLPRQISALEVFCPNSKYGCKKKLAMRDCDLHISPDNLNGCLYSILPCPNACSDQNIFRVHLTQHCKQYCPRRRVTCPHCEEDGEYQVMTDEHPHHCLLHPLPCPQGCGVTLARVEMPIHLDSCPLETVRCPFSGVGCMSKVLRKDLNDHLTSAVIIHLTQLTTAHMSLKNDCTILKKEHKTLQVEHTTLQVEHTTFKEEHKKLQEKHSIVETKLSDVGSLILALSTTAPMFQVSTNVLSSKLRQINNVLVDTSEQAIGSSLSLALSHCVTEGYHYIVVDKFRFKLEWSYKSKMVNFYLIQSQKASMLPNNWGCVFLLKLDEDQSEVQRSVFAQMPVSGYNILAAFCCGKSQHCMDDKSSRTKILVGSLKMTCVYTDVKLTLVLQEHKQVGGYSHDGQNCGGQDYGGQDYDEQDYGGQDYDEQDYDEQYYGEQYYGEQCGSRNSLFTCPCHCH